MNWKIFIMEDRMLQITALQTIPCEKYQYFLLFFDGNVTAGPREVSESCIIRRLFDNIGAVTRDLRGCALSLSG